MPHTCSKHEPPGIRRSRFAESLRDLRQVVPGDNLYFFRHHESSVCVDTVEGGRVFFVVLVVGSSDRRSIRGRMFVAAVPR
jgi:hypothetical protein